jgi:hypothetical protein
MTEQVQMFESVFYRLYDSVHHWLLMWLPEGQANAIASTAMSELMLYAYAAITTSWGPYRLLFMIAEPLARKAADHVYRTMPEDAWKTFPIPNPVELCDYARLYSAFYEVTHTANMTWDDVRTLTSATCRFVPPRPRRNLLQAWMSTAGEAQHLVRGMIVVTVEHDVHESAVCDIASRLYSHEDEIGQNWLTEYRALTGR